MFMAERLGGKHPLVEKVLAGDSPSACAAKLIAGSKLFDVAERKKLFEGGKAAIEASNDALIKMAVMVDGEPGRYARTFENLVEEPERQAFGKIASARFAAFGRNIAPDATFTLRLAFGTVKGYEVDGKKLNYHTTFKEAFDRADMLGHREPFELPKTWMSHKDKIDLNTPFCFVSTADTIGGNSGSPVLNRAGEFVGINFDRNRHGLVRNFVYTDVQARHIAVHSRAFIESLEKIYKTEKLLSELFPKSDMVMRLTELGLPAIVSELIAKSGMMPLDGTRAEVKLGEQLRLCAHQPSLKTDQKPSSKSSHHACLAGLWLRLNFLDESHVLSNSMNRIRTTTIGTQSCIDGKAISGTASTGIAESATIPSLGRLACKSPICLTAGCELGVLQCQRRCIIDQRTSPAMFANGRLVG